MRGLWRDSYQTLETTDGMAMGINMGMGMASGIGIGIGIGS
jgi:hypothetical protein